MENQKISKNFKISVKVKQRENEGKGQKSWKTRKFIEKTKKAQEWDNEFKYYFL